MTDEEFYTKVAEVLETDYTFWKPTGLWKKRWGPRDPGNGRYPGHGLVRIFGSQVHVSLYDPPLSKVFDSKEMAFAEIVWAASARGNK